MDYREEDVLNGDFFSDVRKIRKTAKEDILDESFRKAEISKGIRPKEGKKVVKKPFLKLGIILIIVAIISLVIINYLPWVYIKYNAEYGTIQEFFYKDFENKEGHYYPKIDHVFESPCTNCSNNSKNYLGITKNDFTDTPEITSYGFIILVLLGIIFTIFAILAKLRDYSLETVSMIHSTFAAATVIISIFIMLLNIKFLGLYFLLYYNRPFIETSGVNNVIMILLVPIIIVFISFAIIFIAFTVMKINFHEFEKKLKLDKSRSSISAI